VNDQAAADKAAADKAAADKAAADKAAADKAAADKAAADKAAADKAAADKAAADEPAASESPKPWKWLAAVVVLTLIGVGVAWGLGKAADYSSSCSPNHAKSQPPANSAKIQISGFKPVVAAFGYGRGTREVNEDFTASTTDNSPLPSTLPFAVTPILSGTGDAVEQVAAVAKLQDDNTTYELSVCIAAPASTRAGSYTGKLLFVGPKVPPSTDTSLTATFQSRLVPYVFFAFGPILLLAGIVYATGILLRRALPTLKIGEAVATIFDELWSISGVLAVIAATGAVWAAWNAQCYRNPIWGSPWPDLVSSLVTLAAAAGAAASVPMGLAQKDAVKKPSTKDQKASR